MNIYTLRIARTVLSTAAFFFVTSSIAQPGFSLNGTSHNTVVGIASDKNDNIYIAGTFGGTVDFDPSSANRPIISNNTNGFLDAYVASYTHAGVLRFAFSLPIGYPEIERFGADKNGNTFLIGNFMGSVDFDPGAGEKKLHAPQPAQFLTSYDANGNLRFAHKLNGYYDPQYIIKAALFDKHGKIHLFGTFSNEADFDPGQGEYKLTPSAEGSAFVSLLDTNGVFISAYALIELSKYTAGPSAYAIDSSGIIYCAGASQGKEDFDVSGDTAFIVNEEYTKRQHFYLAKYSPAGLLQDASLIAKDVKDESLLLNPQITHLQIVNNGEVYMAGIFCDTVDFISKKGRNGKLIATADDISANMFLVRYISDSKLMTERLDHEIYNDVSDPSYAVPVSMALDEKGNAIITGVFKGHLDFTPNIDTTILRSPTINTGFVKNAFLASYRPNGTLNFAHSFTASTSSEGKGVCIGSNNRIFMTGEFKADSMDIDPSAKTYSLYTEHSVSFITGFDENGNFTQIPIEPTGIKHSETNNFRLYPNPATNVITLSLNNNLEACTVEILNLQGSVLHSTTINQSELLEINIGYLSAGLYFVRITGGQINSTQRLIVR
ncbi:MAG: T9SS type A sorting domain-containing protein [Bacteroidetes bacterium]|nr:MAG: T9SS type A sorting domain-containing protein [Bacteroidota bacterium]